MSSLPSTSQMREPEPRATKSGLPPTALHERAGLLTPPFGLLVYTVKGAVPDSSVTLSEIFAGSIPYWLLMLVVMAIIWIWPITATFLTRTI